jgi:hypothetical protein
MLIIGVVVPVATLIGEVPDTDVTDPAVVDAQENPVPFHCKNVLAVVGAVINPVDPTPVW